MFTKEFIFGVDIQSISRGINIKLSSGNLFITIWVLIRVIKFK